MARKRKTSPMEDLLDLVSMLPWWVGCGLAIVGYWVLHRLANPIKVSTEPPAQVSHLAIQGVMTGFAMAGQYIVPLIGFGGAIISVFRRRARANLVTDVLQAESASALDGMSWRDFEILVGEAFRLQGFRVAELGGGGPDGGIDLILTKGREKFLVQCKQWKAYKVGVEVIRELYGVMAAKGATGGYVVTSGRFTNEAVAFASGRNIELIDGAKLLALIKQAEQSIDSNASSARPRLTIQASATDSPRCPQCGAEMTRRVARKGVGVGNAFWGCSDFPRCRGIRPLN